MKLIWFIQYCSLLLLLTAHHVTSDCPRPSTPINGYLLMVDQDGEDFPVGSTVWYQCEHDHSLEGSLFRICDSNGTWTGNDSECVLIDTRRDTDQLQKMVREMAQFISYLMPMLDVRRLGKAATSPCPALVGIANGQFNSSVHITQHKPGVVVSYTCDPGYYLDSLDEDFDSRIATTVYNIHCERNGQWNMEEPYCEELICRAPTTPGHGSISPDDRTIFGADENVTFSCEEGYTMQGDSQRVCSVSNRGWSGSMQPTKCINVACPRLDTLANGQVYGRSFRLGDTITLECDAGFSMLGPANRTCLESFQWSGTFTTCENDRWDCPDPGVPVGGSKVGNRYSVGNTVQFQCDDGYIMRGSDTRECLDSGHWSGLDVTCRSAHAYDPPVEIVKTFRPAFDRLKYYTTSSTISDNNRYPGGETRRRRRRHTASMKAMIEHSHRLRAKRSLGESSVKGLDLYFLFDASGSITKKDFQASVQFAMRLVKEVGISSVDDSSGTRIGIVTFSDDYDVKVYPSDRGVNTVDDVLEHLQAVQDETLGGTCMSCGLKSLHKVVIPTARRSMPHRAAAKTVVMMLSDGRHNVGGDPSVEADVLKGKLYSAEIFTVGVTNDVDSEVLEKVASEAKKEHVFLFKDYADLGALISMLANGTEDYSACGAAWEPMGVIRGRVVGGTDAKEGKWRWQVALYFGQGGQSVEEKMAKRYQLQCGGSLIDRHWVLTAAHCLKFKGPSGAEVNRAFPDRVYVKMGVSNLNKEESLIRQAQYIDVDAVYIHKDYDALSLENDMALLHLHTPAVYDPYVGRVCLPDPDEFRFDGTKLYTKTGTVTGWGHTEPREAGTFAGTTGRLQEVRLPIIDDDTCRKSLDNMADFRQSMFCAGSGKPEDGVIRDSCRGDSGGPLVRKVMVDTVTREKKWMQLGIVSWGEGCAQEGHHGFYTKMSLFTTWIKDIKRAHELSR